MDIGIISMYAQSCIQRYKFDTFLWTKKQLSPRYTCFIHVTICYFVYML